MSRFARRRVTAVLGPTNTGKTYLAIERMLGHHSGMIGFPLRLLARENYDRVVRIKGAGQVALVTGEEKILPPGARYFLCTVESMPVDRRIAFLAVDEIQLCADPERGHVFTDRLLNARGLEETMFLGAETIRPVLRRLVPEAETVSRPRFSTLRYSGPRKLTRLAPRSAVVAFSAAEVYATAELMRRQRGGTAVVMGALSPRTRNAQVSMFESGEVDYLVATDAIGLGLNLNLDHVAFARLTKFDGRALRRLRAAEVAQIAGRAGRHMADGTFGTTGPAGPLAAEIVEAIENHRFDPLSRVFWRNADLDFRSPKALLNSLEARPPRPELLRVRDSEDVAMLAAQLRDAEVAALASSPGTVRLLWEVCQVPDFQKTLSDQHARLLGRIYRYLMAPGRRLPEDWVARQIRCIDHADGDIDSLLARIAQVRTWTYVSHRADWLADAVHWQERTREIEDRLSDALHDRLTQRFVDRRAATLVRRLRSGDELLAAVTKAGDVLVEGEHVGRLEGFRFRLDTAVAAEDAKPLLTAARRALAGEVPARVGRIEAEPDSAFALDEKGRIAWRGEVVARLAPGDTALRPGVEPLASEFLDGRTRSRVRRRLNDWLHGHVARRLAPLCALEHAQTARDLNPALRGAMFQLVEAFGLLPRAVLAPQIDGLSRADRWQLTAAGVRLGRESLFLPALLKPARARLAVLLWAVHRDRDVPDLPSAGALAFAAGPEAEESLCHALGYRRFARPQGGNAVALRADALERLAATAHKLAAQGAFTVTPELKRRAGCSEADLTVVLAGLGYRRQTPGAGAGDHFVLPPRRRKAAAQRGRGQSRTAGGATRSIDSPFAKLRELTPGE